MFSTRRRRRRRNIKEFLHAKTICMKKKCHTNVLSENVVNHEGTIIKIIEHQERMCHQGSKSRNWKLLLCRLWLPSVINPKVMLRTKQKKMIEQKAKIYVYSWTIYNRCLAPLTRRKKCRMMT